MNRLKRILRHKDSVSIIMALILLTKVIGFAKLRAFGAIGADREMDLFQAAFLIPDALFSIVVAGSLNAAVIPKFSDVLYQKGERRLVKFFLVTFFYIVLFSGVVLSILYAFTENFAEVLISRQIATAKDVGDGFTTSDKDLLVKLMRIMLISPVFLAMSSVLTAFLQIHRRFFITTLAPFMYNIGMVGGMFLFGIVWDMGVVGFAWAVLLGTVMHFLVQVPIVYRFIKDFLKFEVIQEAPRRIGKYSNDVKDMVKLAIPRVFSSIMEQVNGFVNAIISLGLPAGALSAFRLSFGLHLFPIQVIVGAIAQIALPDMTEYVSKGQMRDFEETYNRALRQIMFLILPVVVLVVVLRLPIVRLVFGFPEWNDTVLTAWCLALMGLSIVFQAGVAITIRALFALHETKLPTIASVISIVFNIVASYFLTIFFSNYTDWREILSRMFKQVTDASTTEGVYLNDTVGSFFSDLLRWFTVSGDSEFAVGGLALGLSFTFVLSFFLNLYFLQRKSNIVTYSHTIKPIIKMLVNSIVMGFIVYGIYKLYDFGLDTQRTVYVIVLFLGTSMIGAIIYLALSKITGVQEYFYYTNKFEMISSRYFSQLLKIRSKD